MIHDPMNIWLLKPGVGGFGILPTLLDDTDKRGGAEQFGERWAPLGDAWRLEGSALHGAGRAFELLGAIWLRAASELVMVFEDGLVAIVAPRDQAVGTVNAANQDGLQGSTGRPVERFCESQADFPGVLLKRLRKRPCAG